MPRTGFIVYREADGRVPLLEWLEDLGPKARAKCIFCLERLAKLGHELRRPHAAYLENGLYELRAKHQRLNLRMLYFFHEQTGVVSHGFIKQQARVPIGELRRAHWRKRAFESSPREHTHLDEVR